MLSVMTALAGLDNTKRAIAEVECLNAEVE